MPGPSLGRRRVVEYGVLVKASRSRCESCASPVMGPLLFGGLFQWNITKLVHRMGVGAGPKLGRCRDLAFPGQLLLLGDPLRGPLRKPRGTLAAELGYEYRIWRGHVGTQRVG